MPKPKGKRGQSHHRDIHAHSHDFSAFFQPLLYKSTISRERWDSRIWFDDFKAGCERPAGTPTTTTATEVTTGKETVVEKETTDNGSLPPKGWCWV